MEGQVNGRELTQSFSLADELGAADNNGTTGDDSSETTPTYANYATVSDRTGILTVDVPTAWG
ncbi:MAG: hypothetical protein R2932_21995 [Caldilineaceae bacterium]